jgi:hypothetical protein
VPLKYILNFLIFLVLFYLLDYFSWRGRKSFALVRVQKTTPLWTVELCDCMTAYTSRCSRNSCEVFPAKIMRALFVASVSVVLKRACCRVTRTSSLLQRSLCWTCCIRRTKPDGLRTHLFFRPEPVLALVTWVAGKLVGCCTWPMSARQLGAAWIGLL